MSRVANNPVQLPKGVEATFNESQISVKGIKGNLDLALHSAVQISREGDTLRVSAKNNTRQADALSGTFRALISNMVTGVSQGFQKKLQLQGVGYRAKAHGGCTEYFGRVLSSCRFRCAKRCYCGDADSYGDRAFRRRQAVSGRGCSQNTRVSSARAVQGQGHSLSR